jgi:hypothetical protein
MSEWKSKLLGGLQGMEIQAVDSSYYSQKAITKSMRSLKV